MTRKMIINAVDPEEVRAAIVENGRLEDFDIETRGAEQNKGNIYKAVVVAVEPSLNAAFVDYGADKQGFLTAGDVDPGSRELDAKKAYNIAELLKPKQSILVQITKDEVGAKGAVLTTYLSLAGRYLVLTPESGHQGVSRKIRDDEEREAMFEAVRELEVPEGMGLILRTAGRDRSVTELDRDLQVLLHLWDNIRKEANASKGPALIFKEQNMVIRALRDYFSSDIDEIILDSDEAYDRASEYMHMVMPKQRSVLTRYVERRPIFHHYRIEDQLDALYSSQVSLPSGGSIVIEPTEALVSIDVNSGKQKAGGHEETAAQTNLEAAQEVARQLRLRDLGGIIVIDFIDMISRKNQGRVEKVLRHALKHDKARVKVGRISRNGTLEVTRQRIRTALTKSVFHTCKVCRGSGRILNPTSHAISVLRKLQDRAARGDLSSARIRMEPQAAEIIRTEKWSFVVDLEQRYGVRVDVTIDRAMLPGQEDFTFETNPDATPVELSEPNFGPVEIPEELRAEFELDEAEEDEAAAGNGAATAKKRARGRRGRADKPTGELELPSFELLDPEDLGLEHKSKRSADSNGDDADSADPGSSRRRRGRRGGRRRRAAGDEGQPRAPQVEGAREDRPGPAAKAAQQPAKKKRGFFGWLFGGSDK